MVRRTITDPLGAFAIEGLGEGQHDLVLSHSSTAGFRRDVNVGDDLGEMILSLNLSELEESATF